MFAVDSYSQKQPASYVDPFIGTVKKCRGLIL